MEDVCIAKGVNGTEGVIVPEGVGVRVVGVNVVDIAKGVVGTDGVVPDVEGVGVGVRVVGVNVANGAGTDGGVPEEGVGVGVRVVANGVDIAKGVDGMIGVEVPE